MMPSADTLMIVMILVDLVLLGSSRLNIYVRCTAVQGVLVGVMPTVLQAPRVTLEAGLFAVVTIAVKSLLFPGIMHRVMRDADVRREEQPLVGYSLSVALGVLALVGSMWLSHRLQLPVRAGGALVLPVALFSILAGLFLIVARRKAVTQVMGYLVMENGIYLAGILLLGHSPLIVELGVLLDLFVGVFLMGILIFHISREFDHIDTDQLTTLKD